MIFDKDKDDFFERFKEIAEVLFKETGPVVKDFMETDTAGAGTMRHEILADIVNRGNSIWHLNGKYYQIEVSELRFEKVKPERG